VTASCSYKDPRGWAGEVEGKGREGEVEGREREGPKVTVEPGPLRALLHH